MGTVFGAASAIGSLASAGSSIANSGGGGNGTQGGNPNAYIPYNQAGVDKSYNDALGTLGGAAGGLPGAVSSGWSQYLSGLQNAGGYGGIAQDAANNAYNTGNNIANTSYGNANLLFGQGMGVAPRQNSYMDSLAALTGQIIPQQTAGIGALQQGGEQAAAAQRGYGNQLGGFATSGLPYAQQMLQTGFDPQNALYNRSYQQNMDQTNAINAMNGVAGSPYGAGLATQSNQNFNIDWQNQQLGRQNTALGAYNNSLGTAGSGLTAAGALQGAGLESLLGGYGGASSLGTAAIGNAVSGYGGASNIGQQSIQGLGQTLSGVQGLQQGGLNTQLTTGSLPYSTYLGHQNDQATGLGAYSQGVGGSYNMLNNLLNNYNSYLGLGQSATGYAQQGNQNSFNQKQSGFNDLGSSFGLLGSLFGGGGSNGINTNPLSMINTYNPSSMFNYDFGSVPAQGY